MRDKLFSILFVGILLCLGLFILGFRNTEEFSVLENRNLSATVPLTRASWLSADLQESMESTLADHFPKRSLWVRSYTRMQFHSTRLTRAVLGILPGIGAGTAQGTSATLSAGTPVETASGTGTTAPVITIRPVETSPAPLDTPYDFNSPYIDFIDVDEQHSHRIRLLPRHQSMPRQSDANCQRSAAGTGAHRFQCGSVYVVNKNSILQ
jgi:hypothetical protein